MKKLKFLVSLRTEESGYQRLNAAAAEQMAGRLGVEVQVLYAGNDAITQSEQLLKAIHSQSQHSRPDGVLCSPVGTPLMQAARSAAAAGIGWALLNRSVDYLGELRRNYRVPVFSVLVDHEEVGRIQAKQMGALVPEGGMALCVLGPAGHPLAEQRLTSMLAAKPANIQIKTLVGDWTRQGACKAVARWLRLRTRHDAPMKLVAAQNDEMAIGAREAFRDDANGDLAPGISLPFLGSNCCPGAGLEWVQRGWLAASIVNPPSAGVALEMMVRAMQTNTLPPERKVLAPSSYPQIEKLGGRPAPGSPMDGLKTQESLLHKS
ncbi:MAG TPA: sugar ABC transporter substrate-binding protein [Terriglobales bacterium]|nr:sugar ABC transporter substrate-binding protein [Terriglobales bacterium]